jgi:hypothetical protein
MNPTADQSKSSTSPQVPKEQKHCPYCGGGNPGAAQICMWCGTPFQVGHIGYSVSPPFPAQQPYVPFEYRQHPPEVLQAMRRMRIRNTILWSVFAIVLVAALLASFVPTALRQNTSSRQSTAREVINDNSQTGQPAPSIAELIRHKELLTDAQWDAYAESL